MKKELHKSTERGKSELGWLSSRFSFSFNGYYNPKRTGFGKLLVLNDDVIEPGKGFGMHPHKDMEIITIVTEGALEHKDNTGSIGVIGPGEVQVMSAGRGIIHSEYNHSNEEQVKLFQIWILPNKNGLKPRYGQKKFDFDKNQFTEVVSGNKNSKTLYINQEARISMGIFGKGKKIKYNLKKGNGVFVLIIEGSATVEGENLEKRDALEISEAESFEVIVREKSQIMVIEVPFD